MNGVFPESAKWITDRSYTCPKKASPVPMTFLRRVKLGKPVKQARLFATALGIYEATINGKKVGDRWFAPGFTSYKHTLLYQIYDVTDLLEKENELLFVVGGGWAVGRFTYENKSRITSPRQALLAGLQIVYEDGSAENIGTDRDWRVSTRGAYKSGDFYDGEIFDARIRAADIPWQNADVITPKHIGKLTPDDAAPVTAHETFAPEYIGRTASGEALYDVGQNLAGVVSCRIAGQNGQRIVIRHAETLKNGELYTDSLRTAKQTVTYICRDGDQEYTPRLTYMGFRYLGVSGIEPEDINLKVSALYSDFETVGSFACSDERLNRLQSAIQWSGKSNLVDIPTDCPQRDERQGWTGDAAIFAGTANFNFSLAEFWNKWLRDLRDEQGHGGGIPLVVPKHGNSAPTVATACWGDACVLVPWAEYLARGDKALLEAQYPCIQKFLGAAKKWALLSGPGKHRRYIWRRLFQFGDWCAPDGYIMDWMKKGGEIATAYFANSCGVAAQIAEILHKEEDRRYYEVLREKICKAYRQIFTNGKGNLKKEFQTAYVLPLYFGMVTGEERKNMANNLSRLVRENDWHLSTGFPGTPYLLFALADNGYADDAYRVLLQETCPSWLYEIKQGATTLWEQWNTITPEGEVRDPSMNHYAYGAVGDFLYRRVAGLESVEGGYKRFRVRPVPGGGLTWAKAETKTPYGEAGCEWRIENDVFTLNVTVPDGTTCEIVLPGGGKHTVSSGSHTFKEKNNDH